MSISFDSVSFSYDAPEKGRQKERFLAKTPNWVLLDLTFTIEDGEFFGIVGHTGSGKSTLLQQMNGLLRPTLGRVLFDGVDLFEKKTFSKSPSSSLPPSVGLVMQYPEQQLFAASVYDDVAFGPRNLGFSVTEVDTRVRQALEQVLLDFDALQTRSPFELSGGQQRRVALAGVLAMQPKVLVLDEPTNGLDPHTQQEFFSLIARLHKEGLSVVLVSHDMDALARLCDRLLVLDKGVQFLLGKPEEVFAEEERLHAIGLDIPLAQRFANELKTCGFSLEAALYDEDSLAEDIAKSIIEALGD